MEKIKVYLQYPGIFPDSPYYKSLLNYCPEGVEYVSSRGGAGVTTSAKKLKVMNFFKYRLRELMGFLRFPFPNAWVTKKSKKSFDMIHCAHCMSLNNSPWVMDIESVFQFWISAVPTWLGKKIVKKILLNRNCKKILAWTKETKKEILQIFPEISGKIEVLYPVVNVPNVKRKKHEGINLVFVGRYFFAKGGLYSLEVMDRLTKKYNNVNAIVVSKIPEKIKKIYGKNKKIKFYNLMPQEKLFSEIYPNSDILVYPGCSDTFGFAFLEAMAFGIPVVTIEGYARNEIITNNLDGFILPNKRKNTEEIGESEEEMVCLIEGACSKLIKNKSLREKMSKKAKDKILNGKFSIKERNKKLLKIYRGALNENPPN